MQNTLFIRNHSLLVSLSFLFLVGFPPVLRAEPVSPGLEAVEDADPATEYLQIKALMADNAYSMVQTSDTKSDVISALEDYLNHMCLRDLPRTLQYDGSPSSETCLNLIDKMLGLDSENPSAICARDGIDSSSCRSAYMSQVVVDGAKKIGNTRVGYRMKKVYFPENQDITDLINDLPGLANAFKHDPSNETRLKLNKAYWEVLSHFCRKNWIENYSRETLFGSTTTSTPVPTPDKFKETQGGIIPPDEVFLPPADDTGSKGGKEEPYRKIA